MIRLPEPIPREAPINYHPFSVERGEVHSLPLPEQEFSQNIFSILGQRQTRRDFGLISDKLLSSLLWFTCKISRSRKKPHESPWEHRPLPSAGGCHCIDLVVIRSLDQDPEVSLYDPKYHALISVNAPENASALRSRVSEIVDVKMGTILLFAADCDKVESRYQDGESLIWRDAGVLVGGISIVSEALNINSCALGFTGQSILTPILNDERFMGVGGIIIGERG